MNTEKILFKDFLSTNKNLFTPNVYEKCLTKCKAAFLVKSAVGKQ